MKLPALATRHPCWTCHHFGGSETGHARGAAVCRRDFDRPVWRDLMDEGCGAWTPSTKPAIRLLVCGGRDFEDRARVFRALDAVLDRKRIEVVIHGAQRGADTLAGAWGMERGIHVLPCPAEWERLGPKAGPLRNTKMLAMNPDGVVAFPGGPGTANMVRQAQAAGVPVWPPYG